MGSKGHLPQLTITSYLIYIKQTISQETLYKEAMAPLIAIKNNLNCVGMIKKKMLYIRKCMNKEFRGI